MVAVTLDVFLLYFRRKKSTCYFIVIFCSIRVVKNSNFEPIANLDRKKSYKMY